jgi:hypothetical protein
VFSAGRAGRRGFCALKGSLRASREDGTAPVNRPGPSNLPAGGIKMRLGGAIPGEDGRKRTPQRLSVQFVLRASTRLVARKLLEPTRAVGKGFATLLHLLSEITPLLGGLQPSIFVVWAFH